MAARFDEPERPLQDQTKGNFIAAR